MPMIGQTGSCELFGLGVFATRGLTTSFFSSTTGLGPEVLADATGGCSMAREREVVANVRESGMVR